MAGPEIAVASTKAYTTQVVVMNMLGMHFAKLRGMLNEEVEASLKESLLTLPEKIDEILEHKEKAAEVAKILAGENDVFYLGRGADFALALEGSLKIKEISYIHSEAYAGGELKHGTIALIEPGTKIIALMTQQQLEEKMVSNIREVKARGAEIIAVAYDDDSELDKEVFDYVLPIPRTNAMVAPVLGAIQLQLLAYYTAKEKGCDIDKPRNLAKSVTVE